MTMKIGEPDCVSHDYEALSVGCSQSHEMEFKSSCSQQAVSGKLGMVVSRFLGKLVSSCH